MSKLLKPGMHWLSATDRAPTLTLYPDPLDLDATPPANTKGLSNDPGDSIFGPGSRDAIIHTIWLADKAGTEILNILIEGTSTVVASFVSSATRNQTFNFGPDGLRVPGGFNIEVAGAGSMTLAIGYEVV